MTEPPDLAEPTPQYAWRFSYGRLHFFHADPARAWCTATWLPLERASEDAAPPTRTPGTATPASTTSWRPISG
ncbi:hypothetical protein [Actinomadura verrucosospora]